MRLPKLAKSSKQRGRSPVVSGALPVIVVAAALTVLFVLGVLAGSLFSRLKAGVEGGRLGPGERPGMTATDSPMPVGEQTKTPDATATSQAPGGDVGPSQDASAVLQPPQDPVDPTPPRDAAALLRARFAAGDIMPDRLGGLVREGAVVRSENSVKAFFRGSGSVGIDIAQVTVVRYPTASDAAKGADQLREEYPVGPLVFDIGGRRVSFAATQEERPDMFPPALSFTWTQGEFAVQLIVIPWDPGAVAAARDRSAAAIADLPF